MDSFRECVSGGRVQLLPDPAVSRSHFWGGEFENRAIVSMAVAVVLQQKQQVPLLHPPSLGSLCPQWPSGATAPAAGGKLQWQAQGRVVVMLSACLSPGDASAGGVGATPPAAAEQQRISGRDKGFH